MSFRAITTVQLVLVLAFSTASCAGVNHGWLLASPHPHGLPCEAHVHRVPPDLLELHRLNELHGSHLFRVEDLLNAVVLRLDKLERSTWLLHDLFSFAVQLPCRWPTPMIDCTTLIV